MFLDNDRSFWDYKERGLWPLICHVEGHLGIWRMVWQVGSDWVEVWTFWVWEAHWGTAIPQSKIKSIVFPQHPEHTLPLLSPNQPNCKALSDLLYCFILDLLFWSSNIQTRPFWKAMIFPFAVFTSLNIRGSQLVLSSGSWLYFWNSLSSLLGTWICRLLKQVNSTDVSETLYYRVKNDFTVN